MINCTLISCFPIRLKGTFSNYLFKTTLILFTVLSKLHKLFFQTVKSRVYRLLAPFTSIFFHIYPPINIRLKLFNQLVATLKLCHQPCNLVFFQLEFELHLTVVVLIIAIMVDCNLAPLFVCSNRCRVNAVTKSIVILLP